MHMELRHLFLAISLKLLLNSINIPCRNLISNNFVCVGGWLLTNFAVFWT
uniref:Uncharacterized protein n=1 Tax=Octopus bimaculoides TaxID=37653 RepID=A0A0L8I582_OCTBM